MIHPANIILGFKGVAITAAVSAAVAFFGGWKFKSVMVEASHAKALERAQDAHREALADVEAANTAILADVAEETAENIRLTAELTQARSNVQVRLQPIIQEVPANVPTCSPDGSVVYDADFVRLFNSAARGGRSPIPYREAGSTPAGQLPGGVPEQLAGAPRPR